MGGVVELRKLFTVNMQYLQYYAIEKLNDVIWNIMMYYVMELLNLFKMRIM